jgi:FMN-dependent NADH-azoreductase
MNDIEFVYADGLAISPETKQSALARAREDMLRLGTHAAARETVAA